MPQIKCHGSLLKVKDAACALSQYSMPGPRDVRVLRLLTFVTWLLHLLALAASSGSTQRYLVPPEKLQILIIGSTDASKAAYLSAARASIAKHFKVHIYTDKDVPACKVCTLDLANYNNGSFVLPWYCDHPFLHRSAGECQACATQPSASSPVDHWPRQSVTVALLTGSC